MPFSYFLDRLFYRSSQRRAARASSRRTARELTTPAMALRVEQLSLGPIGTNCYVVRADAAAAEAVVVDPSGDATELRLPLARPRRDAAPRSSSPTGTGTTSLGVADLAEGTGAPGAHGRRASGAAREPGAVHAARRRAAAVHARRPARGRRDARARRRSQFDVLSVPGHSPAHLAYHADGRLFSGDVLFAGSVGRTDFPGADWETLLGVDPDARRHVSARDRRLPGARPGDDARRRARAEPVPRASSARSATA